MHKFVFLALCAAFLAACGTQSDTDSDYKRFSYDLQGTWMSTDPSLVFGEVEITYNRITIYGYYDEQKIFLSEGEKLPFDGYIKGVAFPSYSEKAENQAGCANGTGGEIFIETHNGWQPGIPYCYWSVPGTYPRVQFLIFKFGDREEVMERHEEEY